MYLQISLFSCRRRTSPWRSIAAAPKKTSSSSMLSATRYKAALALQFQPRVSESAPSWRSFIRRRTNMNQSASLTKWVIDQSLYKYKYTRILVPKRLFLVIINEIALSLTCIIKIISIGQHCHGNQAQDRSRRLKGRGAMHHGGRSGWILHPSKSLVSFLVRNHL